MVSSGWTKGMAAMLAAATMSPAVAAQPERRPAPASDSGVREGAEAWETGNYARALAVWRPLAAAGNADAQYNLAQAYRLGRGVTVDEKQARAWYARAAERGHPQAQANYGLMLFQSGDRTGAMPWLAKAADHGDPRAQYVVGTALFNGDVAGKDWTRAYALMTRASAAGLPQARSSLIEMDRFVPLQQRQQATALARDMERSALLAKADAPAPGPLVRAASSAPDVPAPRAPVTGAPAPGRKPLREAAPPVRAAVIPPRPVSMAAASSAAAGGWRVQVGAYANAAAAGGVWDGIARKAPGAAARSYLVKAGSVTRLQAGPFASRADAGKACARITAAAGTACFPVAAP